MHNLLYKLRCSAKARRRHAWGRQQAVVWAHGVYSKMKTDARPQYVLQPSSVLCACASPHIGINVTWQGAPGLSSHGAACKLAAAAACCMWHARAEPVANKIECRPPSNAAAIAALKPATAALLHICTPSPGCPRLQVYWAVEPTDTTEGVPHMLGGWTDAKNWRHMAKCMWPSFKVPDHEH